MGIYLHIYTYLSSSLFYNTKLVTKSVQRHIIIIIIIIISILKPVFLYRGFSLFYKSFSTTSSPLKTILRVSRIHSNFLSVIDQTSFQVSLAFPISSVQLHLACIPQQSSMCCAQRIPTTSIYWCGAPHPGYGCHALKTEILKPLKGGQCLLD